MVVDLLIKWSARDEKSHPGFVHIAIVNFKIWSGKNPKDAFELAKRAAPMTRGHAMSAKRTLDMRFSQTRNMTLQSARSSRPLVASVPVPAVRTPCASTKPGCESLGIWLLICLRGAPRDNLKLAKRKSKHRRLKSGRGRDEIFTGSEYL